MNESNDELIKKRNYNKVIFGGLMLAMTSMSVGIYYTRQTPKDDLIQNYYSITNKLNSSPISDSKRESIHFTLEEISNQEFIKKYIVQAENLKKEKYEIEFSEDFSKRKIDYDKKLDQNFREIGYSLGLTFIGMITSVIGIYLTSKNK